MCHGVLIPWGCHVSRFSLQITLFYNPVTRDVSSRLFVLCNCCLICYKTLIVINTSINCHQHPVLCVCVCVCVRVCAHVSVYIFLCLHECVFMYVNEFVCLCVCVCVCVTHFVRQYVMFPFRIASSACALNQVLEKSRN